MTEGLINDALNPRFVFASPVFRDEIGPSGQLDSARFADHVDRAIQSWYALAGEQKCREALDPRQLLRDTTVEILTPLTGPAVMRVDVWVEDIDSVSCTYGFFCSSENGATPYARGERTMMHIDPKSNRPEPWSKAFVTSHNALLKDLHAFS
jgi:acyl-CoA thioester hydrolase